MNIHIHADAQNTKNILTLIEEQGFSLPCNCHGAHRCNGARYSFDCSLIPKKPMDVSLPNTSDKIQSVSLEKMETSDGTADTLLIDLGTTTIAMAFIDKESGALRQCKTSANPQAHFGSDVISRIQAATHGNLSDLTDCIRKHIKKETALLCQMTHNDISAIRFCYTGGNTTIIHLLLGYDCTSLVHSPFTIKVPSPEPLSIGTAPSTPPLGFLPLSAAILPQGFFPAIYRHPVKMLCFLIWEPTVRWFLTTKENSIPLQLRQVPPLRETASPVDVPAFRGLSHMSF